MTIAEKLQLIAENEQKVYQAGMASVPDWNAFWDSAQQNGGRLSYNYGFAGNSWTNTTFYPKYDIICAAGNTAYGMFYAIGFSGDLQQRLDECGVVLDTSKATQLGNFMCYAYNITKIPEINATSASSLANAFIDCSKLSRIDKLILKDDGSQNLSNAFSGCISLEDITIEGVIGYNGISFKDCTKLSGASLLSIVGALSTTTSGYTITLSKTAVDNAIASDLGQFLSSWENLLANRTNWTINLV